MQRITDQLKKTLRQIKTQVAKCRREPAWNFSAREDFTALAEELGEQLDDDLQVLKEDLHTVERQMALWAAEGKKARRPVFRRRRSVNPFGL